VSDANFTLSSQAQITPEEIDKRSFSSKVRGVSESEVRSFLRRISTELERLIGREQQLVGQVQKLEAAQKEKHVASKQELLESLGEQTARILTGAQEAADQMVADAKAQVIELEAKGKKLYEEMRIKTDDEKIEREKEVETFFENSKKQAIKNAEIIVENARVHGRELFQEATMLREKILKDLLRRRELLSEQIDELRKGREELLDSYKVVKGSFQKATDALVGVEEKASSELMTNPIDVDEILAAHVDLPAILNSSNAIDDFVDNEAATSSSFVDSKDQNVSSEQEDKSAQDSVTQEQSSVNIISKDSIPAIAEFKEQEIYDQEKSQDQLKKSKSLTSYVKGALGVDGASSESSATDSEGQITTIVEEKEIDLTNAELENKVETTEDKKDVSELFKTLKTTKQKKDSVLRKTEEEPFVKEVKEVEKKKTVKSGKSLSPIEHRDSAIASVLSSALRKAKKQLQNEQNELLDALRTTKSKKRIKSEDVLPTIESHMKLWTENIREEIESVYTQGVGSVAKQQLSISEEDLANVINWLVTPLRETLSSAIDEGDVADVTTRVGAKYREWRNSDLKIALTDSLCATYSYGVIAASEKTTLLQWMVEKPGQCVDCDDNALEPTKVGELFPTGQSCAPAHSGCRCVIAAN
jgi:DivIVA domain-containing protein